MKKMFWAIIIGAGCIVVLIFGFFAYLNHSMKAALEAMHRKEIVAENILITSDWLEITPKNPLEVTKLVQEIVLSIENYENDIHTNDFRNIKLADGTAINPEVQIVDENGKIYQLRDGTRLGNLVGFTPNQGFPRKVTFKTVRIRSDKSFRCKKIYWYDYDLK